MTQTTTPAAGASPTATSQTAADQAAAHKGDLLQLVTFHIADEEFGVDILAVQEIIRPIQITMVICMGRMISCTARMSTPNSSSAIWNVTSCSRSPLWAAAWSAAVWLVAVGDAPAAGVVVCVMMVSPCFPEHAPTSARGGGRGTSRLSYRQRPAGLQGRFPALGRGAFVRAQGVRPDAAYVVEVVDAQVRTALSVRGRVRRA